MEEELQRQFEACTAGIISLEKSKTLKAAMIAYVIGVIGTAFMAGSVFAVIAGNIPLYAACEKANALLND